MIRKKDLLKRIQELEKKRPTIQLWYTGRHRTCGEGKERPRISRAGGKSGEGEGNYCSVGESQ